MKRNLKEYSKKFDEQDTAAKSAVSKEVQDKRTRMMEEWRAWREERKAQYESEMEERVALWGEPEENEDDQEWIEEMIEEVVFEETKVVE